MSFRLVTTPLAGAVELPSRRDGGVDRALRPAFVPAPGVDALLARLDDPNVLVVTTGQQPGLFTGPLYSVHKALSAAALARLLESRWDRPVVPVFWSAGDDHDWAEANHAAWVAQGVVREASLRARPADDPLVPLAREPLGPEVREALALLRIDLSSEPHGGAAVDWIERHFSDPSRTLASASNGALAELLAPFGILVLDPTHVAVKRASAPHLLRALAASRELDRDLAARARRLAEQGRESSVSVGDGASLVMLDGRFGRDRLVLDGERYVTRRGRERLTQADVERIATTEPERLSANVLLRPALESALLPTVAYVAGPGELRYLELTPPVYERLGIVRQRPVPRWSGVIVDARVDRVLAKFGATLRELMRAAGPLEERIVRPLLPSPAIDALQRLSGELKSEYDALSRSAVEVDPTLRRSVEQALRRSEGERTKLEAKLLRALRRREHLELGQLARARAEVWPMGKPQERVVTPAGLLARHGPALLGQLAETTTAWYADALEGRLVPS